MQDILKYSSVYRFKRHTDELNPIFNNSYYWGIISLSSSINVPVLHLTEKGRGRRQVFKQRGSS